MEKFKTLYEIDDRVTAPAFGFQGAEHYYQTQSAQGFAAKIAVPCLIIQAKDDPMIPFRVFDQPAIRDNRNITVLATEKGGHIGFIARNMPRFWVDGAICEWLNQLRNNRAC